MHVRQTKTIKLWSFFTCISTFLFIGIAKETSYFFPSTKSQILRNTSNSIKTLAFLASVPNFLVFWKKLIGVPKNIEILKNIHKYDLVYARVSSVQKKKVSEKCMSQHF